MRLRTANHRARRQPWRPLFRLIDTGMPGLSPMATMQGFNDHINALTAAIYGVPRCYKLTVP